MTDPAPAPACRERRTCTRRTTDPHTTIAHARLRGGHALLVVEVSRGGALIEGAVRFLPGTRVDLHVFPRRGRILVRCRIVRAFVARLAADGIWYRAAVVFEPAFDGDIDG